MKLRIRNFFSHKMIYFSVNVILTSLSLRWFFTYISYQFFLSSNLVPSFKIPARHIACSAAPLCHFYRWWKSGNARDFLSYILDCTREFFCQTRTENEIHLSEILRPRSLHLISDRFGTLSKSCSWSHNTICRTRYDNDCILYSLYHPIIRHPWI